MNPNELHRRELVKTLALGTAQLLPLFPAQEASAAPANAGAWKPKFFSESDAAMVAEIAELIIPRTDTPGAKDAKVHEHIDLVLSEEDEETQKTFRKGLRWLNDRSAELHQKEFAKLDPVHKTVLLTRISDTKALNQSDTPGHEFFLDIRQRVVFAYYTSKIGLDQELTYKGRQVLGHWEGCPHPDHHGDAE